MPSRPQPRQEAESAPPRFSLPQADAHHELYTRVRSALLALPDRFQSDIVISGISVGDLFTLNTMLAATIEEQTVRTLNGLRPLWDPDGKYASYSFVRQPQTFPDVRLQARRPGVAPDIIMGIELKGWYIFAKEGEPSFRMDQAPAACAEKDLICVVPWALTHVISGPALAMEPFVESARWVAEYRNWHWNTTGSIARTRVQLAQSASPYPAKKDEVKDTVQSDKGGNFGRIARTGLMDEFKRLTFENRLAGIEGKHWLRFFQIFTEKAEGEAMDRTVLKAAQTIAGAIGTEQHESELAKLRAAVEQVSAWLAADQPSPGETA